MHVYLKWLINVALLIWLLFAISVVVAGADGNDLPSLRFVQAMPGAPNVDFFIEDQRRLENFGYGRFSNYFTVDSGERNARLFEAGTAIQIVDRRLNYENGRVYTMLAMGRRDNEGERELIRFDNDTNQPLNSDKTSLRFVHASPGAPNVNVCFTGTDDCRVVGLSFKQASGYVELDPSTYSFDVRLTDNSQRVALVPNVRLNRGLTYMLVAIGLPGGNPGIDVITIVETGGRPGGTPPTGAFLTPLMLALIVTILLILCGAGWLGWRQVMKFTAR